jgi:hypothetical protein
MQLAQEIENLENKKNGLPKAPKKVGAGFVFWNKKHADVYIEDRLDPNYIIP